MKVSADRKALLDELRAVAAVIDKTSTMSVLRHLDLGAADEGLVLSGTDLDLSIRAVVDADVARTGRSAPQAHRLLQALAAMTGDVVEISGTDRIVVEDGTSRYELPGLNPDELPRLPEIPEGGAGVDLAGLQRAASRVLWAVDRGASRLVLDAALLTAKDDVVQLVGTDCKVMAVATIGEDGADLGQDVLLGRSLLEQVVRLDGDSVRYVNTPGHVALVRGRRTMLARKPEANFPDWHRIVNKSGEGATAVVASEELAAAVRRVAFLTDERHRSVALRFGDRRCEVVADSDLGVASTSVPCDIDVSVERHFWPQYVIDALGAAGGRVEIIVGGEGNPSEIHGEGLLAVLMPVHR